MEKKLVDTMAKKSKQERVEYSNVHLQSLHCVVCLVSYTSVGIAGVVSSSTKLRQLSRSTGCKADSCRSVSDTLVTGCHKPALSETQANDKDVGSRQ